MERIDFAFALKDFCAMHGDTFEVFKRAGDLVSKLEDELGILMDKRKVLYLRSLLNSIE